MLFFLRTKHEKISQVQYLEKFDLVKKKTAPVKDVQDVFKVKNMPHQ